MTSAAASMLGAVSGNVIRRSTRSIGASISAASSRRLSMRRIATSVVSIESGYKTRPRTAMAAGKL